MTATPYRGLWLKSPSGILDTGFLPLIKKARNNLRGLIDEVVETSTEAVITSNEDGKDVVMMYWSMVQMQSQ